MPSIPTLTPDVLAEVTGGKTSSDEQLTTALTNIQKSLKEATDARSQQNSSGLSQLVPFMFMAKLARREI